MPWPFEHQYMQLALVAGVVVGACAPLIGVFLVQKRMSLMGDGVGHLAFAGVAGGILLGTWPVWSALVVCVVGAVAIDRLRSRGTTQGDLALALFFYGGIAGGVVLLGLSGSLDASLLSYLFGSVLTVRPSEVWVIVALGALILVVIGVCARPLFAMAVDEEWARVAGLPVALLNAVLAVLVAVTIVASMRVVGLLLVAALMVLPVASAQLLARSQQGILAWSMAVGVMSAVSGLVAARVWALAPGGTIVLVAISFFIVVAIGDRLRRTPVLRRAAASATGGRFAGPADVQPVPIDSHSHW